MRSKNKKVQALRDLKRDAPLVQVRRALDALFDIPHAEMARILVTSRSNITAHISGIRANREIQAGICALWGGIPTEELFDE